MNPIYSIGEQVVFTMADDVEVIVIEKNQYDSGVYQYRVAWVHAGERKDAWVHPCEIRRRTHKETIDA